MKCSTCGFDNRSAAKFCGMCGARLALVCPSCGVFIPLDYRFCDACGTPLPNAAAKSHNILTTQPEDGTRQPGDPPSVQLDGERRVATIILADIKGSTDLMEQVGTEAWVEMMNRVLKILEAEVYRYDGKVDQFRGDGLVAFFGTTTAHEDDPERAVLAALAMQQAIEPYATELARTQGINLALRVGVNTGEVIVISVGNERQYREETAMGGAVAIAARMEAAAEPGTVLVSEDTYRLVASQFAWETLGKITVKGISEPIAVYRPLAPRANVERAETYGLISPLTGRDTELEILKDSVEDLLDGIGGIVILTGEQGMGKSVLTTEVRHDFARQNALLAEAHDRIAIVDGEEEPGRPRARWLRGRCRSYTQSRPYAMWQDALSNWLGIRHDEPLEQTRKRLRQRAHALWGERMPEYYPQLATLLSLPLEASFAGQIEQMDADGLRQQFFLTIQAWVEALAAESPVILNFSDMQWADATSLELLKYCLPLCEYIDVLWLLVFRPERTSQIWDFRHYVETEYPHRLIAMHLAPLTPDQSLELIDGLIGPDVLPLATRNLIVQKAEGNPYYIQEIIRALAVQGVLVHDAETKRWRATQDIIALALPNSLQSLLLASIDRLAPEEQRILQMASVIGTAFWSNILEAMAPDSRQLRKHLMALQREQLIRERGHSPELGMEFTFKSSLIRDAAYDSLLSSQRAAYHLQIAQYIESYCRNECSLRSVPQFYGTLAYHYRRAGDTEMELHFTLLGAEYAKTIYANAEALEQYTRAIDMLVTMEAHITDETLKHELRARRFQAHNERRAIHFLMGHFDAMRADAAALLPLSAELADDPAWRIDALLQQPGVADYHNQDELDAGIPMAQEALELAQQIGDTHREMESLIAIVNHRLALGDASWQGHAERALDLARQLNDQHDESRLLIGMGGVYAFSDQPALSMEYLEAAAALAMSQGLEDKVTQMSLLNLLGLEFERSGDYYRLLTEYQQERLHISREIGHRPNESKALQACGRIEAIYLGDYDGGLLHLQECQRILTGTLDEVYPLFHIAHIHSELRQYAPAMVSLKRIREIGEPLQDRGRASLYLTQIGLYIALGDEAHLRTAIDLARRTCDLAKQNPLVSRQYEMAALCKAATAHLKLANIATHDEMRQNLHAQAHATSQAALDIYQAFGFVQIIECVSEEIYFVHHQALAANGQQDEALKYLRWAYDEMTRKHALIPGDSHFRRTYLENIPLHQDIRAAYAARVGLILTESGPAEQRVTVTGTQQMLEPKRQ